MNRQNRLMSMMLLAIFAVGMLFTTSCKKDSKADAEALLKTVPSSVQGAGLINLEEILEKGGDPKTLLKNLGAKDDEFKLEGIKPTYVALFFDGGAPVLTGLLDDPDAFKQAFAKSEGGSFEDQGGVEVCGEARIIGNQFWIVSRSNDAAQCKGYTKLSETQSYASTDAGKRLLEADDDGAFIGDINALLNTAGSMNEVAQMRMALSTLFDGATYLYATMNFEEGKAEIEAKVLDSKMKAAKFNLPMSKVSPDAVKMLGTSADVVAAFSISHDMVEKIKSVLSSFAGGQMPQELLAVLNSIDGTIAVSADNKSSRPSLVITTRGETGPLMSLLNSEGITVTQQGNYLVSRGDSNGPMNAAQVAPKFKDAFAGFIVGGEVYAHDIQGVSDIELMLEPDGNSIKIEMTINAIDKKQNILRTISFK